MQKEFSPGLTQIFYGNGKGKTTAALGITLRACAQDYNVHLVQFLKNKNSSEILSLKKFSSFSYKKFGTGEWFIKNKNEENHKQKAEETFNYLKSCFEKGYNVIIADEILYAVQFSLLQEEKIIELIKQKPKNVELILTGSHKPFPKIFELADLVSEIKKIKHPYDKGILARKGVDF